MPAKSPRICSCGKVVRGGARCECEERRARERKARHDAKRPTARERGYTHEWEREKRAFLEDYPACRRCGRPATLVDHIKPHKGDKRLFWDRANWQPLCAPCHNGWKQSSERNSR